MSATFDHTHKRALSLGAEALSSLDSIVQDARKLVVERLGREEGLGPERTFELLVNPADPQNRPEENLVIRLSFLAKPSYKLTFENNYQFSTDNLTDLIDEFRSEPAKATALRMSCGDDKLVALSLNIQDRSFGSAILSVSGEKALADHTFRRMQRILEGSTPALPWLHTLPFRLVVYVVVNIVAFMVLSDLFAQVISAEERNTFTAAFVGLAAALPATGIAWLAFETLKAQYAAVEFTIGWSAKRNGRHRVILAFIFVVLLVPIVLHWIGLT